MEEVGVVTARAAHEDGCVGARDLVDWDASYIIPSSYVIFDMRADIPFSKASYEHSSIILCCGSIACPQNQQACPSSKRTEYPQQPPRSSTQRTARQNTPDVHLGNAHPLHLTITVSQLAKQPPLLPSPNSSPLPILSHKNTNLQCHSAPNPDDNTHHD